MNIKNLRTFILGIFLFLSLSCGQNDKLFSSFSMDVSGNTGMNLEQISYLNSSGMNFKGSNIYICPSERHYIIIVEGRDRLNHQGMKSVSSYINREILKMLADSEKMNHR